jgi:WXG100 family type VII secretion target
MSDFIRVPYAELFQRAARIRQEAEAMRAEILRVKAQIEGLHWMGQRAERFFVAWAEALPDMERWVSVLDAFAEELEDQARRMQLADDSF